MKIFRRIKLQIKYMYTDGILIFAEKRARARYRGKSSPMCKKRKIDFVLRHIDQGIFPDSRNCTLD